VTWKSKTKSKARIHKKDIMRTGGGTTSSSTLNQYEEQLMSLIGWNVIEGCHTVPKEIHPEELEGLSGNVSC